MKHAASFLALAKDHIELDRLFNKHQRAVLARDTNKALKTIKSFENGLNKHIHYEDHRVLPVYADKGAESPGGTLAIFQAEHRKLQEDVLKLVHLTEALPESKDIVASTLDLLDAETLFKGLLHHHTARESNLLFPRLDERTTEDERQNWLTQP